MTLLRILKRTVFLLFIISGTSQSAPYYGAPLGAFLTLSNNVKGEVFAVDSNTMFVKGFSYDGRSDDAVFWAGSSEYPDATGFAIPNEISKFMPIPAFLNQNIILHLPEGANIKNLRWLSVWNRNSSKSLGSLILSKPILPPHPMAIGPLVNTKRSVSTGDILILDTQTFLIPNFSYDGTGKDVYWWLSKGMSPNEAGIRLEEVGRENPLKEQRNNTVIVTLPKDHFVGDYDTLSVWSRSDGEHYGFIDIPKNFNIPPSPHVLSSQEPEMEEFNCEMLNDNLGLEIRWFIKGDDAIIHLVGNIAPSEYMALGLSKDDTETRFDSADAVVAGMDVNGRGFAVDYFFESNEKCNNGRGMCPDSIHGSADNLEFLQSQRNNNTTIVKFKRRLRAEDKVYDQNIYTDGPQAILWAVGLLLSDGFVDSPTLQSKGNLLLDFGRDPNWNCPPPKRVNPPAVYSKEKTQRIHCPGDHSFRAQLGSSPRSNVKKVWFINGIPTPELVVQRGITYTFIIEGGLNSPYHHPFYITNSQEGGLYKNILEASDEIEVTYAGIQQDQITGTIFPTAEGRLCDWSYSDSDPELSILTSSQEVKQALVLKCEPGQPGKLVWTPNAETPDEVYYQSFTERSLGGKIRVVDFCEETNPYEYLEVNTKGGKPKTNPSAPKNHNVERESEISESAPFLHTEKEDFSVDEIKKHEENLSRNASPEIIQGTYPSPTDKNTIPTNVINSFKISSPTLNERVNVADNKKLVESTITPLFVQATEKPEELFPHDESERSDIYIPHQGNLKETTNQNKMAASSLRTAEDLSVKYPTHSAAEASSISALGRLPLQEFKPQFEGGFIPLVMNPMKDKEFAQTKEVIYHSQPRHRGPPRPFLYNESVPFHGTFKPGIPDFSGFNISNYSQEDASITLPHNQDSLSLLAASKPEPVIKPFPPLGSVPIQLLQRPISSALRLQRPQNFGPRFNPLQQQQLNHQQQNHRLQQQHHQQKQLPPPPPPSSAGIRTNVFPQLPISNKPNFPIPNIREEDLSGVSSQRVYVSMQAIDDKKNNPSNTPNLPPASVYNRNPQNTQPNKMMYPPPIQRRPDFYQEKDVNLQNSNVPQRNFNAPRAPININNKHSQQQQNLPMMQSSGLQGQVHNRPKILNSNMPINSNFQGNKEQVRVPPGPLRYPPYNMNMMQVPQRERIPQVPMLPKGIPIRQNPSLNEKLKTNDEFLNHPQIPGKVFPFPLHMLNNNEKAALNYQEAKDLQISDSSSSKEQRTLPHLLNAELIEVPNKNIPQAFNRDRPAINPMEMIQNLYKTPAVNTNIRTIPQPVPSMPFQTSPHLEKTSVLSTSDELKKTENVSTDEDITASGMRNTNIIPDIREMFAQNQANNRNHALKEKELRIKYDEPLSLDGHLADLSHHDFDESTLEISESADSSSSKPLNSEFPLFSDYDHEDDSDSSDSIVIEKDFSNYNVPFGARLTFPQNGSKIPVRTLSDALNAQFGITRKPQSHLLNNPLRNSNGFMKPVESTTSGTSAATSATSTSTTTTSTTTEAVFMDMESLSNDAYDTEQRKSFNEEEKTKNLYYTPPFSSISAKSHITESDSNKDIGSPSDLKHIPIIADKLEGISETSNLGRRNILPNNSNSSSPVFVMPPKVSQDINLPQISENPPTSDNRTDYSILNHVLTLISRPSESKELEASP